PVASLFFFLRVDHRPVLHSFPTRRSSDLASPSAIHRSEVCVGIETPTRTSSGARVSPPSTPPPPAPSPAQAPSANTAAAPKATAASLRMFQLLRPGTPATERGRAEARALSATSPQLVTAPTLLASTSAVKRREASRGHSWVTRYRRNALSIDFSTDESAPTWAARGACLASGAESKRSGACTADYGGCHGTRSRRTPRRRCRGRRRRARGPQGQRVRHGQQRLPAHRRRHRDAAAGRRGRLRAAAAAARRRAG